MLQNCDKTNKTSVCQTKISKTSSYRLQAQTLPDATLTIGKIYPLTKMAVTFEPVLGKHFATYRHICTSYIIFSMQLE